MRLNEQERQKLAPERQISERQNSCQWAKRAKLSVEVGATLSTRRTRKTAVSGPVAAKRITTSTSDGANSAWFPSGEPDALRRLRTK